MIFKMNEPCPPRVPPTFESSPEVANKIAEAARVAPLYESGLYEHILRKHYSLQRNQNLICNWEKYKLRPKPKKSEPFHFPNDRDMHFYNCMIRYMPSETQYKKSNFRKSMKPGPGVDYGGQMPIPDELHMKILVKDPTKVWM